MTYIFSLKRSYFVYESTCLQSDLANQSKMRTYFVAIEGATF